MSLLLDQGGTNPELPGAANGAPACGGGTAVFHGDGLQTGRTGLLPALHTINQHFSIGHHVLLSFMGVA